MLVEKPWNGIVNGCDYVLHVASPVYIKTNHKQKSIDEAVLGTKNVLNACLKNNIKKVVVTSSIAAILHAKNKTDTNFTEKDFSDPHSGSTYS